MSEKKRSIFIRFFCFSIPFFLVFYVLSIGPTAALIYDSTGNAINPEYENLATIFYTPLAVLVENSSSFETWILKYIVFWRSLF